MRFAPHAAFLAVAAPILAWLAPSLGAPGGDAKGKAEPLPAPEVTLAVEPTSSTGWVLTVKNAGAVPVRLVADARLLRLFVTPAPIASASGSTKAKAPKPPAPKTVECVLPSSMREEGRTLVLAPGARYSEAFDPRLFCLDTKVAPGASVAVRFGFPAKPGAKVLDAPFVVAPLASGLASVKELAASAWVLPEPKGPEPTTSASASAPQKPYQPLTASAGNPHSVADATTADVTIHVKNTSTSAVTVYARPQLVDARVITPRGYPVTCSGPIAQPAPIADFVTTLGVGQEWSATVPLAKLCPAHTFDVPGLYLVVPILRAPAISKSVAGGAKNVFAGDVVASSPQLLRIETGKKPFHDQPPLAVTASAK